jgi:Ni/Fe-hydrogenase 1 B-type cytochrome subunit
MTVARAPGVRGAGGAGADVVVLRPKAKPTAQGVEEPRLRVRIWDLVVRWTHWLIVVSLVVLSVTGIYIGRPFLIVPGAAGEHFVMGTTRVVHFYSAIVFSLAVIGRILWMFVGTRHARWWNFLPITRVRQKGVFESLRFYLFLRRTPPPFAGHNPLAGLAYTAVFGLYLLLIATGLGMYAVSAHVESPFRIFFFLVDLFGGAQQTRWIHHVAMWLLIGFSVHHLYSAILVAVVEKNGTLDSIFSGNKWLPRTEAEQEFDAQRRFDEQGGHE